MNENVCGNCQWYVKKASECHFNPPQVFYIGMAQNKFDPKAGQPMAIAFFPKLSNNCPCCSKFLPTVKNKKN